jgi:MFS family permease
MGAVIGILGGGFLSDRYLRRGVINARVYVVVAGSIAATVVLMPAFASTNLALAAPLMFLGGIFLTLPVAPADAMVADVTPAGLRGRAYSLRSIVRALSSFGPVVVGLASSALADGGFSRGDALRWALVGLTPVYAIGGLVMLFCVRTYPADMAFALAESRRTSAVGLAAPEPVR